MGAFSYLGCNSPRIPLPEESLPKKGDKELPTTRTVHSAGGNLDRMSDDGKRTRQWSITWKSATLEYTDDQKFGGKMQEVSGVLYWKGKVASSFVARGAVADKGTSMLRLAGGVVITSKVPYGPISGNSSLSCGEMVYDAAKGIIDAKGGINFQDQNFVLSGLEALRARADFNVVATPDMFEEKHGK